MDAITYRDRTGQAYLVREAEETDAPGLVAIIDTVGKEEQYIANERAAYSIDQQRQILRHRSPLQLILVAQVQDRVVGMLEMVRGAFEKNRHTGTFAMAILPDARGRGIGEGLLLTAHQWAKNAAIEKIWLSVFATNDRAISLYRRLGYREEARRPDQFRIQGLSVDEVFMAVYL